MDEELKTFLVQLYSQQRTEFKADLAELRGEFKADLASLKTELKAHTETIETRLLTEFWKWAKNTDIRSRQHGAIINAQSTNAIALDERLSLVEERISDLERRRM